MHTLTPEEVRQKQQEAQAAAIRQLLVKTVSNLQRSLAMVERKLASLQESTSPRGGASTTVIDGSKGVSGRGVSPLRHPYRPHSAAPQPTPQPTPPPTAASARARGRSQQVTRSGASLRARSESGSAHTQSQGSDTSRSHALALVEQAQEQGGAVAAPVAVAGRVQGTPRHDDSYDGDVAADGELRAGDEPDTRPQVLVDSSTGSAHGVTVVAAAPSTTTRRRRPASAQPRRAAVPRSQQRPQSALRRAGAPPSRSPQMRGPGQRMSQAELISFLQMRAEALREQLRVKAAGMWLSVCACVCVTLPLSHLLCIPPFVARIGGCPTHAGTG